MNKRLVIVICILLSSSFLYTQNTDSLSIIWQNTNLETEIRYQAVKKYLLSDEPQDSLLISVKEFLIVIEDSNFSNQWTGKTSAFHSIISARNFQTDEAIEYGNQAITHVDDIESDLLAEMIRWLIRSYEKEKDYIALVRTLEKAIGVFENRADLLYLAIIYNELGATYYNLSMFSQALIHYFKAKEIFQQLSPEQQKEERELLWLIQDNIAIVYEASGERKKAHAQALDNIILVRSLNNTSHLAGAYSLAGSTALAIDKDSVGLGYLLEAMKLRKEANFPQWTSETAIFLGNYYLNRKNYREASTYYEEAVAQALRIDPNNEGRDVFLASAQNSLGDFYNHIQKFEKAIEQCEQALGLSGESDVSWKTSSCKCLTTAYRGIRNFEKALVYQDCYTDLKLQEIEKMDLPALREASVRADFDKLRLQDSLSFAQERFQLELASTKQKSQRNWIIIIAIFLLACSLIWFLRRRWKFQAALQAKQAEAQRLRELDSFKMKLYTNLTHEFRTPLTVILGMTKNILSVPQNKFKKEAQLIKQNGQNLLQLINQLLDLSKLEAQSFKLNQVQGDIVPYLRYVSQSFLSHANSQNISLRFFTTIKELVMDFDPEQLKQVMTNLISNAIKFTLSGGEIKIEIAKKEDYLTIEISDTGIGISKENLPHIFDRFYQVDGSTTRAGEGTGIGLAHTQELVKLMKGKIEVESELGQGTHFWIHLPAIKNEGEKRKDDKRLAESAAINYFEQTQTVSNHIERSSNYSTLKPTQTKLLIIEDNPDVVTYLKTCLDNQYEIQIAYNGRIGIELALKHIPDLIISDVMMPEKDGYEVCDALKSDERTSHIPIILLTAKADIDSKLTGLKKGADVYLSKPFDKEELLVRLKQLSLLRQRLKEKYVSLSVTDFQVPKDTSNPEDIFFQKLLQIIEDNYTDDRFSLAELCQKVGMSRSQLFRKMKALVDVSPSAFLRDFRLEKAKQLLETASVSVSEAAYQTGFKDPSYFSKLFKQKFGMQPNYLRK